MYRPLPKELTIKNSVIEGLGLFATEDIKKNSYIGVTHIRDEQFDNKYIRTPLGGFYNHSNNPNVMRMVSDILPKLKFGDLVDPTKNTEQIKSNPTKNFSSSEIKSKIKISSFQDLIDQANREKEVELKYDLERNVKLVSFNRGKINISFNYQLDFVTPGNKH